MPNGKVINTETNEEEDYSADFSYDYATGTIVPEVPGGDNETVEYKVDMPNPEVINKTEGTEVFMTYSYSYSRVYSYSYSWKNQYKREMHTRYYSYSYPIGGEYAHGHYHNFYGNGSVINTDGEEEDIDFDYSYDNATGEIVMEMPGGDNTTLIANGTETIPEPDAKEMKPEIVVTEEIVPVEVIIPEPVMVATYSYSYSKDYSYEVYGYMYSYYYSYSHRIGRQMGKDGHWHNLFANGTVTNDDNEVEDYSIDYSYDYSTGNITVDLAGDEGVGEPEEELPAAAVEDIAPPETTVIETLTPEIPEVAVVPGEPIVLPEPSEDIGSCASIPKPKYNYTYSYDTSYSTSYSYVEQPDGSTYKYSYSYPVYNDIVTDDFEDEYDMEIPIDGDSCPCELTTEAAEVSIQVQDAVQKQAIADAMIIAKQQTEINVLTNVAAPVEDEKYMTVPISMIPKNLAATIEAEEEQAFKSGEDVSEIAEEQMPSEEIPEPLMIAAAA